jgi:hypothetical protein
MEDPLESFEWHVVLGNRFADFAGEDEAEFACPRFFV